jgi:hypothetical protein
MKSTSPYFVQIFGAIAEIENAKFISDELGGNLLSRNDCLHMNPNTPQTTRLLHRWLGTNKATHLRLSASKIAA